MLINDLPNCVKYGTPHLFADDFQVNYSSKRVELPLTANKLNFELKSVG